MFGTMALGAAGSLFTDTLKGNIHTVDDVVASATKGAIANGIGYGISKALLASKVKGFDNLTRSQKKIFLRDNVFHSSQAAVNTNLHAYSTLHFIEKMKLFEKASFIFRAGVYSTITSTSIMLFK